MELIGNLQKLIKGENKYSNLSATEKAFITAYQRTLGSNATPEILEEARNKMNSLDLSPKQKSKLKDMTMEEENKKHKEKNLSKGGSLTKPKMMYGGMANKKKHNYAAGGSVKDRLGVMIAVGKIKPNNAK